MGGPNSQSKFMGDLGPFEEAADRALATMGAAGAGKLGRFLPVAASPTPYTKYYQRSKVNGACHPAKEPILCKDDTSLKLMRSINRAYALLNE